MPSSLVLVNRDYIFLLQNIGVIRKSFGQTTPEFAFSYITEQVKQIIIRNLTETYNESVLYIVLSSLEINEAHDGAPQRSVVLQNHLVLCATSLYPPGQSRQSQDTTRLN